MKANDDEEVSATALLFVGSGLEIKNRKKNVGRKDEFRITNG